MTQGDKNWNSKFDQIKLKGEKPKPEPDAEVAYAKLVFDSTVLGYLCWSEAFDAVSWYPVATRDDTGWSIVAWVEDQLKMDEDISDIVFRILDERGYAVDEIDRDLHSNIASDAAVDHRL